MARSTPTDPRREPLLPHHGWRVVGAAFAAGVLLFALAWLGLRDDAAVPLEASATGDSAPRMDPLPRPLPAAAGASDMPDAGLPGERPQLVESSPEPLPPPLPESQATPADPGMAGAPVSPGYAPFPPSDAQPLPLADRSPPPLYPSGALRRREQGTVVLRVEVDRNGRPVGVALVQRSGSRDLDRAAQQAVRQWRFQPAMVDGQPAPGSLEIPLEFRLD